MTHEITALKEFISGFNIQNILSLGAMMWLFARYIHHQMKGFEKRMDLQDASFEKRMDLQDASFEKRMDIRDANLLAALNAQDERIFQLATGKSLREAMIETKRKSEEK